MQYYKLKEIVLLLCIEGCTKNAGLIVGAVEKSNLILSIMRLVEVIIVDSGRKATIL